MVAYMKARAAQMREEFAFRVYVAETMKAGGEGKRLTKSWHELVRPDLSRQESAEAIAARVIEEAGLKVRP